MALPDAQGGVLILERRRREPFSEEDIALARVQSRQLVAETATKLGHRGFAWSAQLEAVQSVAAQLTRLSSVEEVSATLCAQAHRVLAFDNARVYVLSPDGVTLEAVAFRSHAAEYEGESAASLRVRMGEGITGWVAETGQAVIVPDAARHPRALDVPGTVPIAEESMLIAPLRSEGRVIGVVVLSRIGLDRYDEDELRLLRVLADQTSVAIENARLLAARDRHVAELASLLDISQAVSRSSDEVELAAVLARKVAEAAAMDACVLTRADEATGALAFVAAWDRDPARIDAARGAAAPRRTPGGPLGHAATHRRRAGLARGRRSGAQRHAGCEPERGSCRSPRQVASSASPSSSRATAGARSRRTSCRSCGRWPTRSPPGSRTHTSCASCAMPQRPTS